MGVLIDEIQGQVEPEKPAERSPEAEGNESREILGLRLVVRELATRDAREKRLRAD